MKRVLIILFILFAIILTFFIVVQLQFNGLKSSPFFYKNQTQKFWAHHGYSLKGAPYSILDIQFAVNEGFDGVELDLFYSPELNTFLVAHHEPISDTLLIEDVLDVSGNLIHYWFDLKNLNSQNVGEVIIRLEELNELYQLQHHFMVESKDAKNLQQLTEKGIHTCLWLNSPRPQNFFRFHFWKMVNKITLVFYDYDAISIPYYIYKNKEYQDFYKFNTCTWLGNDMVDLYKNDAANNKQLKIILIDRVE